LMKDRGKERRQKKKNYQRGSLGAGEEVLAQPQRKGGVMFQRGYNTITILKEKKEKFERALHPRKEGALKKIPSSTEDGGKIFKEKERKEPSWGLRGGGGRV